MNKAIGIRLEDDFLKKIQNLSKEESVDRSTIIRKLVSIGYKDLMKERSAEDYMKGLITISEAAHRAEISVWEMEKYLIEQGYKSSYSVEDLREELKFIS